MHWEVHLQVEMLCYGPIESWKKTPPTFSFCAMMAFSNYSSPKARSSICCTVKELHCISVHFYPWLSVFASPGIFCEISYTLVNLRVLYPCPVVAWREDSGCACPEVDCLQHLILCLRQHCADRLSQEGCVNSCGYISGFCSSLSIQSF